MPAPMIDKIADVCEFSKKDIEDKYAKAKEIVKEQYPDIEEGSMRFFTIVTGILKKMIGKDCVGKLGWNEDLNKSEIFLNVVD